MWSGLQRLSISYFAWRLTSVLRWTASPQAPWNFCQKSGLIQWLGMMKTVFYGSYPPSWNSAKLSVIHKKGSLSDPGNYRGISIASAFPKLNDSVLNDRLSAWYKPSTEYASAQSGCSCEEQLLALRLFMGVAKKHKRVMYVIFIDYMLKHRC